MFLQKPIFSALVLLAMKSEIKAFFRGKEFRRGEFNRGKERDSSWLQRGKPLGFRAKLSLGRRGRFEEEIEHFILHIGYFFSSFCSLSFLFCISFLNELIPFTRVLM